MTLRRKGSRSITVGGAVYRWTIAPNHELGVGIVVENDASSGQRLVAWVNHGFVVTPHTVREVIDDALLAGWNPRVKGADFTRRLEQSLPTTLEQCPCCDYFTLAALGSYDICPICYWENDGNDLDQIDAESGPNHMSLRTARDNFRRVGACDPKHVHHVVPEDKRSKFHRAPR